MNPFQLKEINNEPMDETNDLKKGIAENLNCNRLSQPHSFVLDDRGDHFRVVRRNRIGQESRLTAEDKRRHEYS
jgi:hypothetical protein